MTLLFRLRWLLLLVFLPGFADSGLPLHDPWFGWLTLLDLAACAALLLAMNRSVGDSLWAWILLAVFLVGYFAKTYWFAADLPRLVVIRPEMRWVDLRRIAEAYRWITAGFMAYCCVASGLLIATRRARIATRPARPVPTWFLLFTIAVFAALIAAHVVRMWLGIGVLGTPNPELPLGLRPILNRWVADLAPALLLLALWVYDDGTRRVEATLAGVFLAVHTVLFTLHTTSRGGLLRYGLMVLLLWIVTRRLTMARIMLIVGAIALTVAFYPLLTMLRMGRVDSLSLVEALQQASEHTSQDDRLEKSVMALGSRVTGADSMWFLLPSLPRGFSLNHLIHYTWEEPVQVFYTRTVMAVLSPDDFRAPGMLGTCAFLGGPVGVVFFTAAATLMLFYYWRVMTRLRAAPVAVAVSAYPVLVLASDGGLVFQDVISALLVAVCCEVVYRRTISPPKRKEQATGLGRE